MNMRDIIQIIEGAAPDLSEIQQIAEAYRSHIEGAGYEELRGHAMGSGAVYLRFSGLCNAASRKLAEQYRAAGFEATTRLISYQLQDFAYWDQHGRAFYGSDEEFEDAEAFEFGEDHEVVVVDDSIIVDVTADQFHPTNPDKYRVVITEVGKYPYQ
jgi:hypothetical protein